MPVVDEEVGEELDELTVRDGLGPARLRLQGGNVADEFERRFGAGAKVRRGQVVGADGTVLDGSSVLPAGAVVYHYRDLPIEVDVPYPIPVLHRDENILVVDKPHHLATMPRGAHVVQLGRAVGGEHEQRHPRRARLDHGGEEVRGRGARRAEHGDRLA